MSRDFFLILPELTACVLFVVLLAEEILRKSGQTERSAWNLAALCAAS